VGVKWRNKNNLGEGGIPEEKDSYWRALESWRGTNVECGGRKGRGL